MTRAELEAHVDELARVHEGAAFVEAVRVLAAGLDDERRRVLAAVLLDRASDGDSFDALARARARRWRLFRWPADQARSPAHHDPEP